MTQHYYHSDKKIRLDKWLWAARFYKTRALAKQMIDGGKVQYDGQRTKSGKVVEVGAEITLRLGYDEKTVTVLALSDQRRGAVEAQQLYQETPKSIAAREERAAQRKLLGSAPEQRPDKKSRRELLRIKGSWD
ncbi:MAG: ribosome-associated heat shock protein Hsp15 [Nitrincola lacisaponensis]|uniref:Heat shock protein 15 n=1 Tax=Nitrincola lacisaponensis TaxID=267850 RepID=A0A063Y604_9GAMM|nr:ribosome-associated heat shock protein Hsp15 [Nitrincola lacisaponensis]KDE41089.1 Ribosome-associated heat shock protein [Nitrincola lacisaponensis]